MESIIVHDFINDSRTRPRISRYSSEDSSFRRSASWRSSNLLSKDPPCAEIVASDTLDPDNDTSDDVRSCCDVSPILLISVIIELTAPTFSLQVVLICLESFNVGSLPPTVSEWCAFTLSALHSFSWSASATSLSDFRSS